MTPMDTLTSKLEQTFPFWNTLDDDDKLAIVRSAAMRHLEAGEALWKGSRGCLGAFIVTSGVVRVFIKSEEGREVTIARLRTGESCFLGASCVLPSIAFEAYMEAEGTTDCLIITSHGLKQIFDHNMLAENYVLNSLVSRFSDIMWAIQQILFMSMDRRLAIFLYEESLRTKSNTIELTQAQIASAIGSAREVVSRMLRYFSDEKITRSFRGGIEILNKDELKRLAFDN